MIGELLARCTFPSARTTVTVAFSGGPDSAALLALAVAADLDVTAVHVHHGLRQSADDDVTTARSIAGRFGAEFRVEHARVADGANLEARARAARHALLGPDAMFGHTADDQAETTLLAILRGAGATGLAAIRPGPGHPILALRRTDTHELCRSLGLSPALDPTNDDARFRRNRVRSELLPLLDDIADRDITPLLTRLAELLRDDDDLLDELSDGIDPLDAIGLTAAPVPLARRAIRRWLTRNGYVPDAASVGRVLAVAAGDAIACEVAGVGRVSRSQQRLSVDPHDVTDAAGAHFDDGPQTL